MNHVLVFNRLAVKSWSGSEVVDAPSFRSVPLRAALERTSPGELLMVGYGHNDGEPLPRLNKAALSRFARDEKVTLNVVLVDIDYENHEEPPETWHSQVLSKVPFPTGWYRTPHGLRLFWALETPIPLIQADSAITWVHDELRRAGIETDYGTRDWTRLQRNPHAFDRELPHSDYSAIPTLSIPEGVLSESTAAELGVIVNCTRPENTESLTRRELNPISKFDSVLAEDLYRGNLSAAVGDRHSTLLRAAITISHCMESNDPRVPYRMLYASAMEMQKPVDELWRICQWAAASYDSAQKEDAKELFEAKTRASKSLGCRIEDVRQRVILDTGKEFFILDEDTGSYSMPYGNQRQLLAGLKLHAPVLAGDVIWAKEPVADIMRDFASPVSRIVYSYATTGANYNATTGELLLPCAQRDATLKPRFSEPIDQWLQHLFGPEHYDKGLDWLAAAPRLDRPICALYFRGANSVGKGMLSLGIARIWSPYTETCAYKEVVDNYQESFIRTPLILADEKVPQNNFAANDSSVFRRIVGNGVHQLNPKHRTPVTLLGFPRVLITANNEDALNIREDLDQDDLDAVKLRVGYIDREGCTDAKDFLLEKSQELGYNTQYEMTKEWVARGIAEHILWLEENREFDAGNRFLVEGWESDFTRSLVTSAGSAGLVAETLVLAIERGVYSDAVRWFDGYCFVNDSELAKNWKMIRGHEVDQPPSSNSRLKALRSLAEGRQKRLPTSSGKRGRYWAIKGTALAQLAEERNIAEFDEIMQSCAREQEDETGIPRKNNVIDMEKRI